MGVWAQFVRLNRWSEWATLIRAKTTGRLSGDCNMVILALVSPRTHMAISTHKPRYTRNKNAGAHVTFATWVNVAHLSWPVLRPAMSYILLSPRGGGSRWPRHLPANLKPCFHVHLEARWCTLIKCKDSHKIFCFFILVKKLFLRGKFLSDPQKKV